MKCPNCAGRLEQVAYAGIAVDRCTDCKGLWFDIMEADMLRRVRGAAELDISELDLVAADDSLREILCPKCQTRMTHMADSRDPLLTYEKCPVCYGVWFDAGKFRHFYERGGLLSSLKRFFSRRA